MSVVSRLHVVDVKFKDIEALAEAVKAAGFKVLHMSQHDVTAESNLGRFHIYENGAESYVVDNETLNEYVQAIGTEYSRVVLERFYRRKGYSTVYGKSKEGILLTARRW